MAIFKLNSLFGINYDLDHARINQIIFDYDNSVIQIRWTREEADNKQHETKITALSSSAERTAYRGFVTTHELTDILEVALQKAGYDALEVKENLPAGTIV